MGTTYWISLKWLHDLEWTSFETEVGPFKFEIEKTRFGVIQWVVKVTIAWIEATNSVLWLTHWADEFGWYESAEKAKRAVETYLSNVLHYNFNDEWNTQD